MRTPRRPELRRLAPLAIIALAATMLLVGAGVSGPSRRTSYATASAWLGLVGGQRPQVAVGQRMIVVLKAPSLAQRVARVGGRASDSDERRWTASAFAAQKQLMTDLGTHGIQLRVEYSYARVLNGFSAPLDPRAISLLEQRPEVAGVFPVRAAYPASVSSELLGHVGLALGAAHHPDILLPGFDGRGVTIALVDTGVDRAQPYLEGRIQPGMDILGGDYGAGPAPNPDDPTRLERHGTEMAGLLVGAGGPAGVGGIAPGASVLPIRVAGWQRDATGGWAVYSRTDQLIAGLERAADPNQDGDAHDAARIVLVPLAEPYAAFTDSPPARAVEGAAGLDMLVVAPAGNDGPGGPGFGSISGPGGDPAALTVAAGDLRKHTEELRAVVRTGLKVVFDQTVPLAGAVVPGGPADFELATPSLAAARPARGGPEAGAPGLETFFDGKGFSRVAGRAALVPAGEDPQLAVENAARAGAAAVVVYGGPLPAGGLGLEESVPVPVVSLPAAAATGIVAAIRRGARPTISLGAPTLVLNGSAGRVAPFSSRGLAFDGRVKPELTAPGVALMTAEPGSNEDGSPRFGTVNGSSAAAATVAGAAALLAQARPARDAATLKGLLVGSARRLPAQPLTAQGAGMIDLGAAAAAEFAAAPATLAFGRVDKPGWKATQIVLVRNLSTRALRLSVATGESGGAGLRLAASPQHLKLKRNGRVFVTLTATFRGRLGTGFAEGAVELQAPGSPTTRIPWTVTFGPRPAPLVGNVHLSAHNFHPSDTTPAVLAFRAGKLVGAGTSPQIQPLARLDLMLSTADGERLGLLARLRDLLPGRYAFGITGRDPDGKVLAAGRYRLRLIAVPTDGGAWSRQTVAFTIK